MDSVRLQQALVVVVSVAYPPGSMVDVRILATPEDTFNALQEVCDWATSIDLAYAWITSSKGKAKHWGALPLEKVRRAVIGCHFAQTEPHALRALWNLRTVDNEVLRVGPGAGGVYHPKLLIGTKGQAARAVVGSSNLTRGGFGLNTELNVLLGGATSDAPIGDLLEFMDHEWEHRSRVMLSAAWFAQYEKEYWARPKPPGLPRSEDSEVTHPAQLDVGWADYCALIESQEARVRVAGEGSYLQEAEDCARAFGASRGFASMPVEDRKLVAGWGDSTGYFGSSGPAGTFMHLTEHKPRTIAPHIDRIPPEGAVSLDLAARYLSDVMEVPGVGLSSATRLLAAKRPDLFLAVNGGNLEQIKRVFGYKPATRPRYLQLIQWLWERPWFVAPEPEDQKQAKMWQARTALVDAVFYSQPD